MKQRAVDWLQQALEDTILDHEQIMQTIGLFEQAKEMEKEHVKKAFSDGAQWELYGSDLTYEERAKQYYNTAFKSE